MKLIHRTKRSKALVSTTLTAGLCLLVSACGGADAGSDEAAESGGEGDAVKIGIVELNLSNPFFGTLQEATAAAAEENGWEVMLAEAKVPGDSATQVAAIENMVANGVKAIVLDAANPTALVQAVEKARDQGIMVVTVNSSLEPRSASDGTFETDNFAAGELIGQWAKAKAVSDPKVALLDYDLSDGPARGRHDGFLEGFGLTEDSSEIVGSELTEGTVDTGQTAMESLLSANPDVNVVYTINEPVAEGAGFALDNAGVDDAVIVSVDGACAGVRKVQEGVIGATAMQFPNKMGEMAVDAIAAFLEDGTKPAEEFNDSGVVLITDDPVEGLESQTSEWGLQNCWGE